MAGADASRRNTVGCNLVNLADFDIPDKIRELSLKGTAIAERVGIGAPSWASQTSSGMTT
jgi:5-methyltetrahydrofolate--homocysteine methyltransferase